MVQFGSGMTTSRMPLVVFCIAGTRDGRRRYEWVRGVVRGSRDAVIETTRYLLFKIQPPGRLGLGEDRGWLEANT